MENPNTVILATRNPARLRLLTLKVKRMPSTRAQV
jgi:hypothetical protein